MNTKGICLILLVITIHSIAIGQNLCEGCAMQIQYFGHNKCCENCMIKYYTSQLQQNIVHGTISDYYDVEELSQFESLPDTVSGNFRVWNIIKKNGYFLDQNNNILSHLFYLVFLTIDSYSFLEQSSIVLITDDISSYEIGSSYKLTITPFFDRKLDRKYVSGEKITVIGPSHTLFDMVYKNWLIPKLELGRNYFFLTFEN